VSRARCKLHSEVHGHPKVSSILGTHDVFSLHVYVVNFPVELLRKCIVVSELEKISVI